jgi:hypothetical protein
MRYASLQRQQLCLDTLAAKRPADLAQVLARAKELMSTGDRLLRGSVESQGRFHAALGMEANDIERIQAELQQADKTGPGNEEETLAWLVRKIQAQSDYGSALWKPGRVIGPYTPSHPWAGNVDMTAQGALEHLKKIASNRGLVGLRLPLGWAQTPGEWVAVGDRLDHVARIVEKRSHLNAGGFGLWGKVFLEFRRADMIEANAVTRQSGDFYAIQTPESSMGHEWLHAFSYWSQQRGMGQFQEDLAKALARLTYSKAQMRKIFRQSHQVLGKEQMGQQWLQFLRDDGKSDAAWRWRLSKDDVKAKQPKPGTTFWYAQAAWTLAPQIGPGETPWGARRRLMDETLQSHGWEGRGIVHPGYYIDAGEMTAAAFQGDINLEMKRVGLLDDDLPPNLVISPLPVESQVMRPVFSRMFKQQAKRLARAQEDMTSDKRNDKT